MTLDGRELRFDLLGFLLSSLGAMPRIQQLRQWHHVRRRLCSGRLLLGWHLLNWRRLWIWDGLSRLRLKDRLDIHRHCRWLSNLHLFHCLSSSIVGWSHVALNGPPCVVGRNEPL